MSTAASADWISCCVIFGLGGGAKLDEGRARDPGGEINRLISAKCAAYTRCGGSSWRNEDTRRFRSERANFGLAWTVWTSEACRMVSWCL